MPGKVRRTRPHPQAHGAASRVTHVPAARSHVTAPDGFAHAPGLPQRFPLLPPQKACA